MKRLFLGSLVLIAISALVVFSAGRDRNGGNVFFPKEERNPVTHLRWNENDTQFQFAIVSDRTGGHRAEIFSQAVEKLNLMQPAFVISVGDLIEGGKKTDKVLAAEWKEFDGFVNKLQMPFFYVPGNHDVAAMEAAKVWDEKLGRRHYHFVYRNTLFLLLDSNVPKGGIGIAKEQAAWAQKVLADNADVQHTIVSLHHPLWNANNGDTNGWGEVEKALKGRQYTVFCGHVHRYEKWVRQGMNYYQLATTGGSSKVRGLEYAEFDHFAWVTMKKEGPVVANLLLDKIYNEGLTKEKTVEPVDTSKRLATNLVRGYVYFEGTPTPGAIVTLTRGVAPAKVVSATGVAEADGSFKLSTYTAFDGAPAGDYKVSVTWRERKGGPNALPTRYAAAATTDLSATIIAGANDLKLELKK